MDLVYFEDRLFNCSVFRNLQLFWAAFELNFFSKLLELLSVLFTDVVDVLFEGLVLDL